jgi:hypothetical protein
MHARACPHAHVVRAAPRRQDPGQASAHILKSRGHGCRSQHSLPYYDAGVGRCRRHGEGRSTGSETAVPERHDDRTHLAPMMPRSARCRSRCVSDGMPPPPSRASGFREKLTAKYVPNLLPMHHRPSVAHRYVFLIARALRKSFLVVVKTCTLKRHRLRTRGIRTEEQGTPGTREHGCTVRARG